MISKVLIVCLNAITGLLLAIMGSVALIRYFYFSKINPGVAEPKT